MAILMNDNFQLNAPKAFDSRLGKFAAGEWTYYATINEVLLSIPIAYRYKGMEVPLYIGGEYVDYCFKAGIQDSDFVQKTIPQTSVVGLDATIDNLATKTFVTDEILANELVVYSAQFTGEGTDDSPLGIAKDNAPAQNSFLPVQSGGVYTALQSKISIEVAASFSAIVSSNTPRLIHVLADETNGDEQTMYFFTGTYYIRLVIEAIISTTTTTTVVANKLDPPANFTATPYSIDTINLSWDDVADSLFYVLYRSTQNIFGTSSVLDTVNGTTYSDIGLSTSSTHYYWIVAVGNGSSTSDSDPAGPISGTTLATNTTTTTTTNTTTTTTSSTTTTTTTLPKVTSPTNFTATANSSSQITLTWDDVPEESFYVLYFNTVNVFSTSSVLFTPAQNAITYVHGSIPSPNTAYYYWIVAAGDNISHIDSNIVGPASATTLP